MHKSGGMNNQKQNQQENQDNKQPNIWKSKMRQIISAKFVFLLEFELIFKQVQAEG